MDTTNSTNNNNDNNTNGIEARIPITFPEKITIENVGNAISFSESLLAKHNAVDAEKILDQCRELLISQKESDRLLIECLKNLASAIDKQAKYEISNGYWKECLKFTEKVFGRKSIEFVTNYSSLGYNYDKQGKQQNFLTALKKI